MKKLLVLAALAACGDNGKAVPGDGAIDVAVDAGVDAPPDAPPDGPPVVPTFTSFTIDLIQNKTSNTTDAVPFATFMGLVDPDLDNAAAYNVLFP